MHEILRFFSLKDFIPLVLLIVLLQFVGKQMGGDHPTVRRWARAISERGPRNALNFLGITIQALLAMGTMHGLAQVLLPILYFFYLHVWVKSVEANQAWAAERAFQEDRERLAREQKQREEAQRERVAEQERKRREAIEQQPPPPTREERLATAQQTYETKLRVLAAAGLDDIELRTAQEKAKQQYVRELDEAMR